MTDQPDRRCCIHRRTCGDDRQGPPRHQVFTIIALALLATFDVTLLLAGITILHLMTH